MGLEKKSREAARGPLCRPTAQKCKTKQRPTRSGPGVYGHRSVEADPGRRARDPHPQLRPPREPRPRAPPPAPSPPPPAASAPPQTNPEIKQQPSGPGVYRYKIPQRRGLTPSVTRWPAATVGGPGPGPYCCCSRGPRPGPPAPRAPRPLPQAAAPVKQSEYYLRPRAIIDQH